MKEIVAKVATQAKVQLAQIIETDKTYTITYRSGYVLYYQRFEKATFEHLDNAKLETILLNDLMWRMGRQLQ